MKKNIPFILAAAMLISASSLMAQQAKKVASTGGTSPHETTSAPIDGCRVTITYGRPFTKDPKTGEPRQIWGGLVPWDKAWRMGSDEATVLITQKALTFGDTEVPAGAYTLYAVPSESGGKLAISKSLGAWGVPVNEKNDLARVDMKKEALDKPNDQFTMAVAKGASGGGVIKLMWDNTQFSVPFTVKKVARALEQRTVVSLLSSRNQTKMTKAENCGRGCPQLIPVWAARGVLVGACVLTSLTGSSHAAEPPPGAAILQDLRSFREMGTVLHIAAHPDDENTQLITYFARGRGYRAGYLSITRGDGGQNEIGPEFDEKLGVARTQELMAARRLDGGRQFFTRAIDFGFSKTPEETLRFWDREQVLSDVVRVIRTFRPDVIVTRFPVPPGSGGHGHHTASAMLAVEAFKVCGDAKVFPEQIAEGLKPWQPKRVLWNGGGGGRGGGALGGPTVRVDIGGTDPVTGESFGAIAGRSRAMHKTQGFGNFGGGGGANVQTFTLLAGEPATNDLMDGVELTWSRVTGGAEIGKLADEAIAQFKSEDPAASVPALLAIRAKLTALAAEPLINDKRQQLDGILKKCLGLRVETTTPEPEVAPGETVKLHHSATVHSSVPVRWVSVRYPALKQTVAVGAALKANEAATRDESQTIPAGMPLTQPYWLREEGAAGIFRVDDKSLIGTPENSPTLPVEFIFEVGGQPLVVADEPLSTAAGGKPQKLAVIAPVALNFGSGVALFKPGASKSIEVEVAAARSAVEGTLKLKAPTAWNVSPAQQLFKLSKAGDRTKVAFTVSTKEANTGSIVAVAEIGGAQFSNQRTEIRYDHIPVQLLQPPAKLKVAAFDFSIRGKNVGYLPGAGDDTMSSLQQLGYAVTTLKGADLTAEKLRGLDAVVVGVRAFNERTDLAANISELFAYVENGGTVIVQYNRPTGLRTQKLGPYPLSIQGNAPQWRVTDETVPVTFLAPQHAALTTPNQISHTDFDGWVQERGAYFPSSFDAEHYTSVLAMSDPGEAPLKSSVLIAQHGKGYFVYTGLAFFRQLPAGVPGAYRLFANLVSLGK